MFLQLLLLLCLQNFTILNAGVSATEKCHHEKNNGCESGFVYIIEENSCIDVIHFTCPQNTGKVFEFIQDPYLCNVHHACHKGTEIDRVCCASSKIFNVTQRSCIDITGTNKALSGNCAPDPCAQLSTTDVCNLKIILPAVNEYPTDSCNGTTTAAPITTTTTSTPITTAENTEPHETTINPRTTSGNTGPHETTINPLTTSGNTGPHETTINPRTTSGNTGPHETTITSRTTSGNTGPHETTMNPLTTSGNTGPHETTINPRTTSGNTEPHETTINPRTTSGNTGPHETTINPQPTSTKPGPPEECTSANEGEYFCDPEDPQKFYYCSDGVLIHDSCIGINVFDCQNKICVPQAPLAIDAIQLFQDFQE